MMSMTCENCGRTSPCVWRALMSAVCQKRTAANVSSRRWSVCGGSKRLDALFQQSEDGRCFKCADLLSTLKLTYEPLPATREGLCGAPAPILLKSLGGETKVV